MFTFKRPSAEDASLHSAWINFRLSDRYRSAYRALSMAEKRAAFILRRRRSLGFSKCRWLRTSFKVPSRSIFFFNRRNARSTDSPFLSLISVKFSHFLSILLISKGSLLEFRPFESGAEIKFTLSQCQPTKNAKNCLGAMETSLHSNCLHS